MKKLLFLMMFVIVFTITSIPVDKADASAIVTLPSCEASWASTPQLAAANGAYQVGEVNSQPEGDYITMEAVCIEWQFTGTTWHAVESTRQKVYYYPS